MNVLVVGQGGREHALCKELNISPSIDKVFVYPGNDGMALEAELLNASSYDSLIEVAKQQNIKLAIIGPEADLVAGLSDKLRAAQIPTFGPSQNSSQLEASKIFCKDFLNEFHVPTARSYIVRSKKDIEAHLSQFTPPYVLKADGLCAGKGVFICKNKDELLSAATHLFEQKVFGSAGEAALLEEFTSGYELSLLYVTNGTDFCPLPLCQDHKRLKDYDLGPNTGGMGVIGPMSVDKQLLEQIESQVLAPIRAGFKKRKFDYRGILYVGLMITDKGPSVLEFNVRFGDPEAQVILPLLHGDWAQVFLDVAEGKVPHLNWRDEFVACVVLASPGYPDSPQKGLRIEGDAHFKTDNSYFLHAGTKRADDYFVTNGGRVLNAVGKGLTPAEALSRAYAQAKKVSWPNLQMRYDIGKSLIHSK